MSPDWFYFVCDTLSSRSSPLEQRGVSPSVPRRQADRTQVLLLIRYFPIRVTSLRGVKRTDDTSIWLYTPGTTVVLLLIKPR
jgi:hypothetical protein